MSRNRSQNQNRFQFKSSGQQLQQQFDYQRATSTTRIIGIKTPLEVGDANSGLFKMHTSVEAQVADNIKNLIKTNKGERLGNFNFGANLIELAFENVSAPSKEQATRRISEALGNSMPYVDIEDFELFTERFENDDIAKVGVDLIYSIPRLGVTNKKIEIILGVAG